MKKGTEDAPLISIEISTEYNSIKLLRMRRIAPRLFAQMVEELEAESAAFADSVLALQGRYSSRLDALLSKQVVSICGQPPPQ